MRNIHSKRVGRAALSAAVLSVGLVSHAIAVPSAFEIEGNINTAADQQDFLFTTSAALSSASPNSLKFETFQHAGGVNLYGDTIASGGIDSVLNLFSGATSIAKNDDKNATGARDSLLTWAPTTPTNATSVPVASPLAAGAYRLNISAFNNTGTGRYNLELLADAFTFTGVTTTGTATLKSLKFAATQTTGTAQFTLASGTMTLQDTFTAGVTLNGFDFLANANLTGGTLNVGGVTTVGHGSSITLSSGIFNANGDVNLLGSMTGPSTVFNLATNKSLNLSSGGVVNFSGNYALGSGKTINVQAGSSFTTQSYLDIGTSGTTGTVVVDGAGASLSSSTVSAVSSSDWGINGGTANVTISNTGVATINSPTLNIATSAVGSGTVLVNTGGVMTAKNTNIATGTGGLGSITVDGSLSSVSLVGTSTLSLGAASGATGTGTINVNNSGVFNTGSGTINVNKTGTINIGGGTLNAKGDINFNGGKLLLASGGFNLTGGKNLTASSGAQVSFTGSYGLAPGSTYTIQSGSSFTSTDFMYPTANVTLNVDGVGTTWSTNTLSTAIGGFWGYQGSTANVTISNQAIANINSDTIFFGSDDNAASSGTLMVTSGAQLNTMGLQIADGSAGTGNVTVTGANSKITQTQAGGYSVIVGGAGTSVGTLNINSSGTFTTALNGAEINKTGTVNIGGGTLNANGDVILDGGKLLHTSGAFNLAAGKYLTASNGAQVSFTGGYVIENGSTVTIQSGSSFSATDYVTTGLNSAGTLVVTGMGSSFASNTGATTATPNIGASTANVTVADQATATFNTGVYFGFGGPGNCTVNITTGGDVVYGDEPGFSVDLSVGGAVAAGASVITVNGTGSTLKGLSGSAARIGGAASTTPGTVNLQASGLYTTGTGTTTINKTGTVNINGGTFTVLGDLSIDGGKVLHTSGGFSVAAGKNTTVSNAGQLSFAGSFSDNTTGTITVQTGGSFSLTNFLDISTSANAGAILVTGAGSSLTTNTATTTVSNWGSGGKTASVTFADQATGNLGAEVQFSQSGTNTSSTLNVNTGAQLTTKALRVGGGAATTSTATINVTGTNSKITMTSSSALTVGNAGTSVGTINLQTGGTLLNGLGSTTIAKQGTINNPSGTFITGNLANDGVLNTASSTTVASISGTGTTNVSGGTLNSTFGITQDALALSSNGIVTINTNGSALGVTVVNAFSATGTSKLDLKDNDLIVDYNATGVSPYTTIRSYVISGLGASHVGITSSSLLAGTSLAVVDDLNTVATLSSYPIPHAAKSVLVKYTWIGDANLDGKVDGTDYALTDSGFASTGNRWNLGDYNYSGSVDGTDYALIDTGFGSQSGTLPEPTMIGLLGLGAMIGLKRRHRRT